LAQNLQSVPAAGFSSSVVAPTTYNLAALCLPQHILTTKLLLRDDVV
jgi:hypothetical protein